jgi:hypothetical protein
MTRLLSTSIFWTRPMGAGQEKPIPGVSVRS